MNRIYFMRPQGSVGPIKIGCSRWPDKRLVEISHWSPVPLELIAVAAGSFKLERYLHEKFGDTRMHKEWFVATPELLAAIDRVIGGQSIMDACRVMVGRPKRSRWVPSDADRLVVFGPRPLAEATAA